MFFLAIFILAITLEIVIPKNNIWILFEVDFYKNLLGNPILWIFYAIGLLIAIAYSLNSPTDKN